VGKGAGCAVGHARRGLPVLLAVPVLALAGCASTSPGDDAANRLLFSPRASATAAAEPSATAVASLPPFPRSCDDVVPTDEVVSIVGTGLPGRTTFVFAAEQADIQRVGRVTCGYGVRGARDPAVEITVNDYEDVDAAAARIDVTLDAAAQSGDRIQPTSAGGYDATVLSDSDSSTLVLQAQARTLVVTMQRGLVPRAAEPVVLTQLAERVLQVAPGVPTPLPTPEPTPEPTTGTAATPTAGA
jgi:hypothetical protein